MSVYHLLVVCILLSALLMHGERKNNITFILVAFTLLFCVYGLRDAYSVGNDSSSSYLHQFQSMKDTDWSDLGGAFDWIRDLEEQTGREDKNAGFEYLMKFIYEWTDGDYQVFVSVLSFFVILAHAHLVRRYSPNPLQSILYFLGLLYFLFHFNALKQSAAMLFILYSFDAIIDRKPIKFLFLVIIASIFHYPALVFLPAYWIGNMRLGRGYLLVLGALMLLVYLFRDNLMDWMSDAYYGEEAGHVIESNSRFLMNKVIVMIVIIVAALIVRPPDPSDSVYNTLLSLIGIASVLQTFTGYGNIFERLADYYFQFSIIFIPMVFEDVKTKRRHLSGRELTLVRRLGPYLFCAFAIWRFLDTAVHNTTVFPYHFYFQAEKAEETLAVWLNLL